MCKVSLPLARDSPKRASSLAHASFLSSASGCGLFFFRTVGLTDVLTRLKGGQTGSSGPTGSSDVGALEEPKLSHFGLLEPAREAQAERGTSGTTGTSLISKADQFDL